jgi:hypothetical protein
MPSPRATEFQPSPKFPMEKRFRVLLQNHTFREPAFFSYHFFSKSKISRFGFIWPRGPQRSAPLGVQNSQSYAQSYAQWSRRPILVPNVMPMPNFVPNFTPKP